MSRVMIYVVSGPLVVASGSVALNAHSIFLPLILPLTSLTGSSTIVRVPIESLTPVKNLTLLWFLAHTYVDPFTPGAVLRVKDT